MRLKNVHQSLFKSIDGRSVRRPGKRDAGAVRSGAGHKIASYYRENISGTKLDRPELGRLLMDSHRNDILLVEQIDRLTRLSNSDWRTLKSRSNNTNCGLSARCPNLMAGTVR